MKSFKDFILEYSTFVPVVDIETTGTDVSIPETKNELNRNIALTLRQSFKTVEESLAKLSKILAMYSLTIPQVDSNDKESDTLNIPVGRKNVRWDEFDGEISGSDPYILKFSYILQDGIYKCSARIM